MRNVFIYFLVTLASLLFIYNLVNIDYNNPFEGNSYTAVISAAIDAIGVVLLLILLQAKRIDKKSKEK